MQDLLGLASKFTAGRIPVRYTRNLVGYFFGLVSVLSGLILYIYYSGSSNHGKLPKIEKGTIDGADWVMKVEPGMILRALGHT